MRIAVPLFGELIAPRFCAADRVLVVDAVDGSERARAIVVVPNRALAARLGQLAELGVQELLCGGFSRRYLPMAMELGIAVTWGLRGGADELVLAFLAGQLPRPSVLPMARRVSSGRRTE